MISQFILGQSHYGVGGDTKKQAYPKPNKQTLCGLRVILFCLLLLCSLELNIEDYCAMSGIHVLKLSKNKKLCIIGS